MSELIGRVFSFESQVFPNQSALCSHLVVHGQARAGDFHAGQLPGLDRRSCRFVPLRSDQPLPVTLTPERRLAGDARAFAQVAE